MNDGQLLLYRQQRRAASFVRVDACCAVAVATPTAALFTLTNISGYDCVAVASTPPLLVTSLRGVPQVFRIVGLSSPRQK